MCIRDRFMAALAATVAYHIAGDELHLLNADGQVVATFTVLEPASLTGVPWVAVGYNLALIHLLRCRRTLYVRSRWSPYHLKKNKN